MQLFFAHQTPKTPDTYKANPNHSLQCPRKSNNNCGLMPKFKEIWKFRHLELNILNVATDFVIIYATEYRRATLHCILNFKDTQDMQNIHKSPHSMLKLVIIIRENE